MSMHVLHLAKLPGSEYRNAYSYFNSLEFIHPNGLQRLEDYITARSAKLHREETRRQLAVTQLQGHDMAVVQQEGSRSVPLICML